MKPLVCNGNVRVAGSCVCIAAVEATGGVGIIRYAYAPYSLYKMNVHACLRGWLSLSTRVRDDKERPREFCLTGIYNYIVCVCVCGMGNCYTHDGRETQALKELRNGITMACYVHQGAYPFLKTGGHQPRRALGTGTSLRREELREGGRGNTPRAGSSNMTCLLVVGGIPAPFAANPLPPPPFSQNG